MDTDTNIRIAWDVRQPVNYDASVLVVRKYEWTSREDARAWTLTLSGWEQLDPCATLNLEDFPHQTGLEWSRTGDVWWWEKWVKAALIEHGFDEDAHNAERSGSVERKIECPAVP